MNLAAPATDHRDAEGVAAFVLALRARGIRDTGVLGAMERVPRELFAPNRFADLARSDVALPIPCGQTMTAPGTVAAMLVALRVEEGQRVLEVGTGSGYVTALLARIGATVLSIERYATLADSAAARLRIGGYDDATVTVGDGLSLDLGHTRFDRILINGSSRSLPPALTSLLAAGGRLVAGLLVDDLPRLTVVERDTSGRLAHETGAALRLSPLSRGRAAYL